MIRLLVDSDPQGSVAVTLRLKPEHYLADFILNQPAPSLIAWLKYPAAARPLRKSRNNGDGAAHFHDVWARSRGRFFMLKEDYDAIVVMKMIEQLSQTYRIPVLNAIRTDQIIGKAARAHKMIADLDPKAKALEDYEAATTSLLEMFDVEESARNPHGETVAV